MEVEFNRPPHPRFIALHYLVGGAIFLFAAILVTVTGEVWNVFNYSLLLIAYLISGFMVIWGSVHLWARKKNKGFPLGNYAVRKILKAMYSKRGLRDLVIMAPYVDEKGERYLKYFFSVRFPVILFPVEVTIKYENFKKLGKIIEEIGEMQRRGEIVRIEYEKDENYFPKGIKFYLRDGSVKEMRGELAEDLIFLLSLKRLNARKLYKRMKAWGVPGVK